MSDEHSSPLPQLTEDDIKRVVFEETGWTPTRVEIDEYDSVLLYGNDPLPYMSREDGLTILNRIKTRFMQERGQLP